MKEFALKRAGVDESIRRLEQRALELEVNRRERQALLESLREGIPVAGGEFLLPFFCPGLVPVTSYLPENTLVWLDGAGSHRGGKRTIRPSMLGSAIALAIEEHRLVAPGGTTLFERT
jgi:transcription-repair coupling factor (superfamily II helicase)